MKYNYFPLGSGIKISRIVLTFGLISIVFIASICFVSCTRGVDKMEYTISMENPSTHYYHVTLSYNGVNSKTIDCKLPVWAPGYYLVINYSKNLLNFKAEDKDGTPLDWEKTTKNTWKVQTNDAKDLTISYDIYAFAQSVAEPFLDANRGFIPPTGVFMYVDGFLNHPVTVTVNSYSKWNTISTGLEVVDGAKNTYFANDFDILYDSPILVGNQEVVPFNVKGIPHYLAMEFSNEFDTSKLVKDLKRIVESASAIVGDIPYENYSFLVMGEGRGGLEHKNSMAVFSSGTVYNPNDTEGYKRWLGFIAHEYFHLYNVKSIRPIALGPFDYNKENYTNMLWFSEGGTVYYEYLILNRTGLFSREDFLNAVKNGIKAYEDIPGHLFQAATASSFDTWINFFNRSENARNTTISYYDKGFALCLLLDLKIRNQTQNSKSLDDVMRTLYYDFFKGKQRGFTDKEFQDVCEEIAGCSLQEIFTYASTTIDIDYPKYFSLAGLSIDITPKEVPGCWFGVKTGEEDGKLIVMSVDWNSPAFNAGLSAKDTLVRVEGAKVNFEKLKEILKAHKPGDVMNIIISNRTETKEIAVTLGALTERSFKITPMENPDPLQTKILNDWLKE